MDTNLIMQHGVIVTSIACQCSTNTCKTSSLILVGFGRYCNKIRFGFECRLGLVMPQKLLLEWPILACGRAHLWPMSFSWVVE